MNKKILPSLLLGLFLFGFTFSRTASGENEPADKSFRDYINDLESESWFKRDQAMRRLVEKSRDNLPDLSAVMDRDSMEFRWRLEEVLMNLAWHDSAFIAKLGQPETADKCRNLIGFALEIQNADIRFRLVSEMGKNELVWAEELLAKRMKDESMGVREAAAQALSRVGGDKAVDALVWSLPDSSSLVKAAAIDALHKLMPKAGADSRQSSVEAVYPLAVGDNLLVKQASTRFLQKWSGSAQEAFYLDRVKNEGNPALCSLAVTLLGRMRSVAAIDSLKAALENEKTTRGVKLAAIWSLGEIASHHKSEGNNVCNALKNGYENSDVLVRREIISALGKVKESESAELKKGEEKILRAEYVSWMDSLAKAKEFKDRKAALDRLSEMGAEIQPWLNESIDGADIDKARLARRVLALRDKEEYLMLQSFDVPFNVGKADYQVRSFLFMGENWNALPYVVQYFSNNLHEEGFAYFCKSAKPMNKAVKNINWPDALKAFDLKVDMNKLQQWEQTLETPDISSLRFMDYLMIQYDARALPRENGIEIIDIESKTKEDFTPLRNRCLAMLNDPTDDARLSALIFLGGAALDENVEVLQKQMTCGKKAFACAGANALHRVVKFQKSKKAFLTLVDALKHENQDVKDAAYFSLVHLQLSNKAPAATEDAAWRALADSSGLK